MSPATRLPKPLIERVEKTIRQHGLLARNGIVLAAVSGGADSVFLLLALKSLAAQWRLTIHAFHLNHGLRGREADRDERFVRKLCAEQDVPCTVRRTHVRTYAREHRQSLEEAGRNLRYELLLAAARRFGADSIATGHNANDNAETVILNLVRGSGLAGLSGIPVRRRLSSPGERGVLVIRPLIAVQRSEIEAALQVGGIRYCRDSSNSHLDFRRNAVRHGVLPLLTQMNPSFVAALSRTSGVLRDECEFMDRAADKALRRLALRPGDQEPMAGVETRRLNRLDIAVRRRVLRKLVPWLDSRAVEDVMALAASRRPGRLTLPGKTLVWKERDRLFVGPEAETKGFPAQPISVPGKTRISELELELETEIADRDETCTSGPESGREVFDMRDIALPLVARTRASGDRMAPFGGRPRKLKEIMIDDRVPRRLRDRVPVLCDRQGILWVVGGRRAERGRVRPDTREVLTIKAVRATGSELRVTSR